MSAIEDAMKAIEAYEAWAEEIILAGVDVTPEAYRAHLVNLENARIVNEQKELAT
jgi:hypothetical protein